MSEEAIRPIHCHIHSGLKSESWLLEHKIVIYERDIVSVSAAFTANVNCTGILLLSQSEAQQGRGQESFAFPMTL